MNLPDPNTPLLLEKARLCPEQSFVSSALWACSNLVNPLRKLALPLRDCNAVYDFFATGVTTLFTARAVESASFLIFGE